MAEAQPRKAAVAVLTLAWALLLPLRGGAQELLEDLPPEIGAVMRDALKNPSFLNPIAQRMTQKALEGPLDFLDDLEVEFKYFNAEDTGDDPTLGLRYRFARQVDSMDLMEERCGKACTRLGLALDFSADGNVAFKKSSNPNDFLDTDLSLGLLYAHGGPKKVDDLETEYRKKTLDLLKANAAAREMEERVQEALGDESLTEFQLSAILLAHAESEEEIESATKGLQEWARQALDDLYVTDLSAELGFESNQDFSARQFVYGGRLGLSMQGYSGLHAESFREAGWIAWINLPDYVPAFFRMVTRSERCGFCFVPRGETFPIASLGIAVVDPQEDDTRSAVGDLDPFPRFDLEIAFSSTLFRFRQTDVNLSLDYRIYQELGASSGVEAANLDQFQNFVLTVGPRVGPFISYGVGELPFDQRDQQVVEVGLRADLESIRDFLLP